MSASVAESVATAVPFSATSTGEAVVTTGGAPAAPRPPTVSFVTAVFEKVAAALPAVSCTGFAPSPVGTV